MQIARRDAAIGRHVCIRPEAWRMFYQLRERGQIPATGMVRIMLTDRLEVPFALVVPQDLEPWQVDLSICAGLDVRMVFDGNRERFGRVRDWANAILATNPLSLTLMDAPGAVFDPKDGHVVTPARDPRYAVLKRARGFHHG